MRSRVLCFWEQEISSSSLLSTARLFDCLHNNLFCLFTGEIRNSQVCDGLTPADLRFGINGNLGNLYCYSRSASINNYNLCVFFLGQDITSQNLAC